MYSNSHYLNTDYHIFAKNNRQMKRLLQLSLLALGLLLSYQIDLNGQRNSRGSDADQYFDESGGFAHRLWYGGGFVLGFSGSNVSSNFTIGLSPMVGYKLTPEFSVGPRVSLEYSIIKTSQFGPPETVNPLSWGLGLFSRYKVLETIFAQVEYEFANEADFLFRDNQGELQVARREQSNFYIGAGYNSGNGIIGYEILFLYNVNEPENSLELPIDLRFGFTYNF